jgi:hypothetical protein
MTLGLPAQLVSLHNAAAEGRTHRVPDLELDVLAINRHHARSELDAYG